MRRDTRAGGIFIVVEARSLLRKVLELVQVLKSLLAAVLLLLFPDCLDLARDGKKVVRCLLAHAAVPLHGEAVFRPWPWPVGTPKDRMEFRGEEQIQGPAAGRGEGLAVVLVYRVEIGALVAVYDDGDEVFVEKGCDGRIREGVLGSEAADWVILDMVSTQGFSLQRQRWKMGSR